MMYKLILWICEYSNYRHSLWSGKWNMLRRDGHTCDVCSRMALVSQVFMECYKESDASPLDPRERLLKQERVDRNIYDCQE